MMSKNFPGNMQEMLQQVQRLQKDVGAMHAEVLKKEIEASAGGGMVTVKVNGAQEVLGITIDPIVVNGSDIEMLQDLVRAAVNEGVRKSKEMVKEELSKVTGGIPIPGLG